MNEKSAIQCCNSQQTARLDNDNDVLTKPGSNAMHLRNLRALLVQHNEGCGECFEKSRPLANSLIGC